MNRILDDRSLDVIFREARTHRAWHPEPVSDAVLASAYELAKMAPTGANCSPMRILFLRSADAKARLKPALAEGNQRQTMTAPVTALIAYDLHFHEHLPHLYPHADARAWYVGKPELTATTAFRNGTLQGAYFILAARALGLDCGPMGGFDNAKVDAEFFPEGRVKSNFLCNLGHGSGAGLRPRSPRLAFDQACVVL